MMVALIVTMFAWLYEMIGMVINDGGIDSDNVCMLYDTEQQRRGMDDR